MEREGEVEVKEREVEVKGVKRPPRAQRFLGRTRREEGKQRGRRKGSKERKRKVAAARAEGKGF